VVPSENKINNTITKKMKEAMNLGALDNEFYIGLFSEKFGLKQLSEEEGQELLRLATVLHNMTNKGWFEQQATIDMAKYIYELYPHSWGQELAQTWIALNYAQMLSGPTTSILNLWSAGNNILQKPIRDVLNLSKWVKALRTFNKTGKFDFYNPVGEMFYVPLLQGIMEGSVAAKEVYLNGDFDNKFIEMVVHNSEFQVPKLERNTHGRGKALKPWNIKIGGKKYDMNLYNAAKYVGRNLSAQDKLMFNTSFNIEIAQILRDKIAAEEGISGKELTKRVKNEITSRALSPETIAGLEAQVEEEAAEFEKETNRKVTDNQKRLRLRELKLQELDLTQEELAEAEKLARSNIFTDDRYGLVARTARIFGTLANKNEFTGFAIKPFVPFTKVVGNVAEYMFDHVPVYGIMRANGWGITGMANRISGGQFLEKGTSQLGERGSRAYYEQMGRAWFGTIAFTVLGSLALGSDEDDFIQVTGGYSDEGFRKAGRENVTPKYTLRIGNVEIPYMNIPGLAIPLGMIGNVNDRLNQGVSEGDITERMTVAMTLDAMLDTMVMAKDMSFVQGIESLFQMLFDIVKGDPTAWDKAGEKIVKNYFGFVARPLPWQNNFVNQVEKLLDPVSYSQKEIKQIVAYSVGIQRFVNEPNIDIFGEVVKTYPGETLMPYTHWAGIKGDDRRWKFLAEYNAIPNKIYNQTMLIEKDPDTGRPVKRRLEPDEFRKYTQIAGKRFDEKLRRYIGTGQYVQRSRIVFGVGEDEQTGVQIDVDQLWTDARADARKIMGIRGSSTKIKYDTFRDITKEK